MAHHCRVRDGSKVLDVGCGKGYLLRRWAKRWAIDGTGLETRPAAVANARRAAAADALRGCLRFSEGSAANARTQPGGYNVITCLGASFALGGFEPAAGWMKCRLRPGTREPQTSRPGGFLARSQPVARLALSVCPPRWGGHCLWPNRGSNAKLATTSTGRNWRTVIKLLEWTDA